MEARDSGQRFVFLRRANQVNLVNTMVLVS